MNSVRFWWVRLKIRSQMNCRRALLDFMSANITEMGLTQNPQCHARHKQSPWWARWLLPRAFFFFKCLSLHLFTFGSTRAFFHGGEQGLLFLTRHWLLLLGSTHSDTWASGAVAHGLGCSRACKISVPGQGVEPAFSVLTGGFLTPGPLEMSP